MSTVTKFDLSSLKTKVSEAQKDTFKRIENCSYAELPMSESQIEAAQYIVTTLAKGWFHIIGKAVSLTSQGKKLYGTHPFKQFAAVLKDETSRRSFKVLYESTYNNKYSVLYQKVTRQYFDGMASALNDRVQENGLGIRDHIEGFTKEIDGNLDKIHKIIENSTQSQDWLALFEYLATYKQRYTEKITYKDHIKRKELLATRSVYEYAIEPLKRAIIQSLKWIWNVTIVPIFNGAIQIVSSIKELIMKIVQAIHNYVILPTGRLLAQAFCSVRK